MSILGGVLTAYAPNFAMLCVARGLVGLAVTTMSTTVFSLLADLFAASQRGRASMVIIVGQYVGMSASFAIGGALLAKFGFSRGGWRLAMLYLTAPLLAGAIALIFMKEPHRSGVVSDSLRVLDSLKQLWSYRRTFAPLLLGLVSAEMAVLGTLTWAAPALSRTFLLTPARIGLIMSGVVLVSGVVGPALGGIIADLCQRTGGPYRTLRALGLMALCAVPASFFGVASRVAVATASLMFFMMLVGSILAAGIAVFTIVIPNEVRGLGIATLSGVQVLFGVALAPLIVSEVSGNFGGPATIGWALGVVCAANMLVCCGAFVMGTRLTIGYGVRA